MTRVAILGATGYTAVELIKLLLRHPQVEIAVATSRSEAGKPIAAEHPALWGRLDLTIENPSPQEIASRVDCVFSCLPHTASAEQAPIYLDAGVKVVDFSADYRLGDAQAFQAWYGVEHPDPGRLGSVPYGLPELFRDAIRQAPLVANPGCYPTSAILALAPLLRAGLVEPCDIIVDSKSGVSGAGRKPKLTTHYPECNESLAAYAVGTHRHTPEIERILGLALRKTPYGQGDEVSVVFTPHLTPMDRGILSTVYGRPTRDVTTRELLETLRTFYANEPFVQVVEELPATKHVAGTNFCHITARVARGRVVVVAVIDNLIKGASGAALQNFNLMFGYEETAGLLG